MNEREKILLSIFLTALILCFGFAFVCGNNVIVERERIANNYCISLGYKQGEYQIIMVNPNERNCKFMRYRDKIVCRNHSTSFPNDFISINISGEYGVGYCESYATWR